MVGTLRWRVQEAFDVLRGRKKTEKKPMRQKFPAQEIDKLDAYEVKDEKLKNYLSSLKIEFCFSEFGKSRVNAGGADFNSGNRLDPSLATVKKFFPNAVFKVYSDFDIEIPGIVLHKIDSPPISEKNHPRYNYRVADYYKFKSLLDSDADFVCVMDSDMFIFSEEIYSLIYLTEKFGFCAPYNPRNLMKKDMQVSLDTAKITDRSNGYGHSYNQSPMTAWKNDANSKIFFQNCCEIMIKEPSRASLVMWKAANKTGLSPYLLPQQWCVCGEDVGIGNEVILHVGHPSVAEYYNIKM